MDFAAATHIWPRVRQRIVWGASDNDLQILNNYNLFYSTQEHAAEADLVPMPPQKQHTFTALVPESEADPFAHEHSSREGLEATGIAMELPRAIQMQPTQHLSEQLPMVMESVE
jgi:hypothetical protein